MNPNFHRARGDAPVALLALATLAVTAFLVLLAASPAAASSGGTTVGGNDGGGDSQSRSESKYDRLWDRVSRRDKRWARRTAECESGGDPRAIGNGGMFRGAFQFMKSTWRAAPKSPGGDPIRYSYRTQAVVAVALKNRDGAHHWPNCG